MDIAAIISIAGPTALVTLGAAWGGVKVTLNGTKARVEKLETHSEDTTDRLARIETKIDLLMEKK
jgi:hypothetical protein